VDYLGETFWPGKGAGSGALDITGHRKDTWYFWRSAWTNQPVLHLFPHWNWPARVGQTIPVLAYTDCNHVELFLNGRSLGVKSLEFPAQGTSGSWNHYALPVVHSTTDDLHLEWDVTYQPGVLRAVGTHRDGSACATDEVRTAGAPAALRLAADRDTVTDAPGDVALVRFVVVDSAGTVVPTAGEVVHVAVTGGRLVALDNGDLRDHEPYQSDSVHAFDGRGLAILRAARPGVLRVTATAGGLREASATVVVRAGAAPEAVPAAR
jgi:beta-galactosidase